MKSIEEVAKEAIAAQIECAYLEGLGDGIDEGSFYGRAWKADALWKASEAYSALEGKSDE